MFDPNSRYYNLETAVLETPALETSDRREVAYKRRRFLPQGNTMPQLTEVTVIEGDRLDTITARTLSDPEQFWRIADANDAMDPTELAETPGRRLRIALPQADRGGQGR